jgi:hypothetical protein
MTSRLERTVVSEKMIEDDLNHVEESVTKFTNKLGVGFERCEHKGEKSAPKFVPSSNYHKEEEIIKSTKTHYPSNPKPSFNPKREVRKETPKPGQDAFIYMFCGHAGHLDDFLPRTSSRASSCFFHVPNHRSYDFGSQENSFVPRRFGYGPRSHRGDHFPRRHGFLAGGLILTLSPDTLMVHIFPVVVYIPLVQMVRCKRL